MERLGASYYQELIEEIGTNMNSGESESAAKATGKSYEAIKKASLLSLVKKVLSLCLIGIGIFLVAFSYTYKTENSSPKVGESYTQPRADESSKELYWI